MENKSVEEMLEWLRVEPRTKKWDSVLAFDRAKTNTVLLQEYIGRFSTDDYLAPITEEILDNSTPTQKEYIVDYVFDSPRLSFQNASLQNSKAQLDIKVVGGTHLTFSKVAGDLTWSIARIALEDALDGPKLSAEIDLAVNNGVVSSAGQVEIKIDQGVDYKLTYVDTPHLQRVAGERIKQLFSVLPEKQTTFVLNQLKFEPDQFLKPKEFIVRTHNKKGSGARLQADENDTEGAVLLFVTMEGGTNGDLPATNKDLRYLLADGYSATVLLSHEIIKEKIIVAGMRLMNQSNIEFKYTPIEQDGGFYGIRAREGALVEDGDLIVTPGFDLKIDFLHIEFIKNPHEHLLNVFSFLLPGYMLSTDPGWVTKTCSLVAAGYSYQSAVCLRLQGKEVWIPGTITFTWNTHFPLDLVIENGDVKFVPRPIQPPITEMFAVSAGTFEDIPAINSAINLALPKLEEWLRTAIHAAYDRFMTVLPRINTFTLNSLLFRGDNTVQLDNVHIPTDMVLFGHVGPTLTAFTLNRLEHVIGHSEEFKFATVPLRNDVTWKVENIPGSSGNPGSIDATTGLYKAPTSDQLVGDHTRLKVTATDGTHSSSALVSVLRRGITINPLVQIATAGDSMGNELSAGSLDGGPLDWSVDPASDARVVPSEKPGGDHTYFPGEFKPGTGFSIDTIEVTNPRTRTTEYSTVLVIHGKPYFAVDILKAASFSENSVQLVVLTPDGRPIEPGVLDLTWQVLAGSGRVDEKSGVFEIDPAGTDKFSIITVKLPEIVPGMGAFYGFKILPIPLFSVPEAIRMLSLDGK
ncbi:hypothetical protein PS858_01372 [Pseudomonas fluorescens]|uniref:Uncharacterized protein n=1 Tax=Pseudomonas fluorescens TaxID=294 RepID=A0A5E7I7T1_PSEFL|nr:hypothetical protein [Pseudomonas fluorescens]VVO10730.1 hypothetical protein PS704_03427 [Pseudomonas fluorescens]VVO72425.1 hypothetical protein PS858_01372 [Pseudomonas fluorescens]